MNEKEIMRRAIQDLEYFTNEINEKKKDRYYKILKEVGIDLI